MTHGSKLVFYTQSTGTVTSGCKVKDNDAGSSTMIIKQSPPTDKKTWKSYAETQVYQCQGQ